jgi:hypothetical protein
MMQRISHSLLRTLTMLFNRELSIYYDFFLLNTTDTNVGIGNHAFAKEQATNKPQLLNKAVVVLQSHEKYIIYLDSCDTCKRI